MIIRLYEGDKILDLDYGCEPKPVLCILTFYLQYGGYKPQELLEINNNFQV